MLSSWITNTKPDPADIDGKTRVDRAVLARTLARRHQHALLDLSVGASLRHAGPDALRKAHLLAGDRFRLGRGEGRR